MKRSVIPLSLSPYPHTLYATNMKALLIGASGATGKDLLEILLSDSLYSMVVIFARRPLGIMHEKLVEVITDFDQLDKVTERINGDVLFSCMGTTLKIAGSKDKQWHIDHEIPLRFAEIAQQKGVRSIVLLSAFGASANSRVFYSKMKGELEEGIKKLGFEQCIIFRPGMLIRKNTDRTGERIGVSLLKFLNSLGLAKSYRPLPTSVLAEKMAKAPGTQKKGIQVIELDKIFEF